jgi:class 3 adenylate cyclase
MERRLAAILAADMAGYSRLMEADEEGVLVRQKGHRRELIDPEIHAANGRIVKSTGDGLLVEFGNAVDAVRCAVTIQSAMPRRETDVPPDQRIHYRVGINLGDILFEEGDVFGDAVNVAARLEGLSQPGAVCVSDIVHQLVDERIEAPFRNLGSQRVKNISRPVRVWQWTPDGAAREAALDPAALHQQVTFCTAADGVQIACSSVGAGPPLLKAPNWLNHIEYEWRSPFWGPFLRQVAANNRLVRFDQRGNGLSTGRWPRSPRRRCPRTWRPWRMRRGSSASLCSASRKAAPSRSAMPSSTRSASAVSSSWAVSSAVG